MFGACCRLFYFLLGVFIFFLLFLSYPLWFRRSDAGTTILGCRGLAVPPLDRIGAPLHSSVHQPLRYWSKWGPSPVTSPLCEWCSPLEALMRMGLDHLMPPNGRDSQVAHVNKPRLPVGQHEQFHQCEHPKRATWWSELRHATLSFRLTRPLAFPHWNLDPLPPDLHLPAQESTSF